MTSKHIIYGEHEAKTLAQMDRCMAHDDALMGVLCADGHLGYAHPIGGVIGYGEHISISGVGFDIACGNMAVKIDLTFNDVKDRIASIADAIADQISFGIGRTNAERVDHPLFESDLFKAAGVEDLKGRALDQLGTVGAGNHYVDIFRDIRDDHIWIGVHFGSRGLGHTITKRHLEAVGAVDAMETDPALLPVDSDLGRSYLAGIELGGLYAYAGREWVIDKVRRIISPSATVLDSVHNHHNFAWRETHGGRDMWVVRKGATPAFPNQRGFVGGSMGDLSVILEGIENVEAVSSMHSTIHGAGRVVGRMQAKGKRNKAGDWVKPAMFTREEMDAWVKREGVELRGGDVDESPMVYRRLPLVLDAHRGTTLVTNDLEPLVVVMAPAKVFDPYKD